MCFGGPKIDTSYQDFAQEEAVAARQAEEERQARIAKGLADIGAVFEGGTTSAGTTHAGVEPLLDQRRSAQQDYYMPQLDQSFDGAQDELTYSLARAGQGVSTTADKKRQELKDAFSLEKQGVLSKIDSDISNTRSRYSQNRSGLEASLRASGDATAATNAALSSSSAFFKEAPTLDPVGDIFAGFGAGIGAARNGYDTGRIKSMAAGPNLNDDQGRVVA